MHEVVIGARRRFAHPNPQPSYFKHLPVCLIHRHSLPQSPEDHILKRPATRAVPNYFTSPSVTLPVAPASSRHFLISNTVSAGETPALLFWRLITGFTYFISFQFLPAVRSTTRGTSRAPAFSISCRTRFCTSSDSASGTSSTSSSWT